MTNNTTFEQTRNDIVRAAYENCRVAAAGEELCAEQMQKGVRELNVLLKFWQAQGFHMWKLGEAWLFCRKGQFEYKLGDASDLAVQNVRQNKVIYPAYAGFNQIYLCNKMPMPHAGDFLAVVIGSEIFITKVNTIENNVVTLTDLLPSCVNCGAEVYFFNQFISRPQKILQARRQVVGGNEIEMVNLENADYFRLPQKEQPGSPTSWTYVPDLDAGRFFVWNAPVDDGFIIKFTYEQAFDLALNSKDVPDVAQEWLEPLTWELAYRLSAYCGLDLNEREWLKAQAKETLEQARIFDQETGGFQIMPDYRGF